MTSGVMYPPGRPFEPMRTGDEGARTHNVTPGLIEGTWQE
jgi:hypothetical protein